MPFLHKWAEQAYQRARYRAYREQSRIKTQRWKLKNPKRYAYLGQRHTSKQRGIEFNLTFEEFVEFWGDDFSCRGTKNPEDLQMCRYDDEGPYQIGNIYKASKSENSNRPRPLPQPDF